MHGPDGGLTFITSLRHPDSVIDYARIERLLVATLRSLDNQSIPCRVVVVGGTHFEVPGDLHIPVDVVVVDFPVPVNRVGTHEGRLEATRLDRGSKHAVALSRVHGGYVMTVDADDFVSSRVAAYVHEHAGGPGWYVEQGFRYDHASGMARKQDNFNDVCGTSLIFRRDLMPQGSLHADGGPGEIVAAWGEHAVMSLLGSHRRLRWELGLPPLPFRAAVYNVNTGENISGSRLTFGWSVSARTAREFGIVRPRRSVTWSAPARHVVPALLRAGKRRVRALVQPRHPSAGR